MCVLRCFCYYGFLIFQAAAFTPMPVEPFTVASANAEMRVEITPGHPAYAQIYTLVLGEPELYRVVSLEQHPTPGQALLSNDGLTLITIGDWHDALTRLQPSNTLATIFTAAGEQHRIFYEEIKGSDAGRQAQEEAHRTQIVNLDRDITQLRRDQDLSTNDIEILEIQTQRQNKQLELEAAYSEWFEKRPRQTPPLRHPPLLTHFSPDQTELRIHHAERNQWLSVDCNSGRRIETSPENSARYQQEAIDQFLAHAQAGHIDYKELAFLAEHASDTELIRLAQDLTASPSPITSASDHSTLTGQRWPNEWIYELLAERDIPAIHNTGRLHGSLFFSAALTSNESLLRLFVRSNDGAHADIEFAMPLGRDAHKLAGKATPFTLHDIPAGWWRIIAVVDQDIETPFTLSTIDLASTRSPVFRIHPGKQTPLPNIRLRALPSGRAAKSPDP